MSENRRLCLSKRAVFEFSSEGHRRVQQSVQLSPALTPASSVSRSRQRITPTLVFSSLASCKNTNDGRPLIQRAFIFRRLSWLFGGDFLEVSNMSEKLISRRGAFSLLGLAAALALPTTALMTTDAEAQAQPSPAAPAPAAAAPTAPATSGMNRRQARRAGRHERREARRNAREMRREARHGNNLYMKSNTTKQK
jgi:hypothetical protein